MVEQEKLNSSADSLKETPEQREMSDALKRMAENAESGEKSQLSQQEESEQSRDKVFSDTNLERKQEKRDPEANMLDKLDGAFYFLGAVTRKNIGKIENSKPERPLSVRRERAELYKRFKKTKNTEERKQIVQEARERDSALEQFLNQGEVEVSDEDFGEAKARFSIINPQQEKEKRDKPPIVFIPGISNDLACVETISQELSLSGRRVITIAFPESFMGRVSEKFAERCEQVPGYATHAKFFEEAIKKILPEGDIELWGYSTGGPISAKMLTNNPEFSKRVKDAVLINPAGSVEQSKKQLSFGVAKEVRGMASKDTAKFVMTVGRKIREDVEVMAPEHEKLRNQIFGTLMDRIQHKSPDFNSMRVREGGKITVVSYDKDDITKCRKFFNPKNQPENPQVKTMVLKGCHMTPVTKPKELLSKIEK